MTGSSHQCHSSENNPYVQVYFPGCAWLLRWSGNIKEKNKTKSSSKPFQRRTRVMSWKERDSKIIGSSFKLLKTLNAF